MAVGGTTIGPIDPDLRDRVKQFRDDADHPNYNAALEALLNERED